MTLEQLSYLGQLIAAVAVVVSIVYLGIQTRQAARNAKAAIHENRSATIVGHIDHIMDAEFHPVWTKGSAAATDMSDAEVGRYTFFVGGLVVIWEERFRQKQEGMLDEDRWGSSERSIRLLMRSPGFRATIGLMRPEFDPAFGAFIDRHLAEGRAAGANVAISAVWRSAAAAELSAATSPAH
jgi:hypothetical protein